MNGLMILFYCFIFFDIFFSYIKRCSLINLVSLILIYSSFNIDSSGLQIVNVEFGCEKAVVSMMNVILFHIPYLNSDQV